MIHNTAINKFTFDKTEYKTHSINLPVKMRVHRTPAGCCCEKSAMHAQTQLTSHHHPRARTEAINLGFSPETQLAGDFIAPARTPSIFSGGWFVGRSVGRSEHIQPAVSYISVNLIESSGSGKRASSRRATNGQ